MLLKEARFCAIDLETTGLNPREDEIIAFAAIPMYGHRISVRESYYTLVHPRKYKLDAMRFHGISQGDLRSAPFFEDVATKILQTLLGIMIAQSVEHDYEFLKLHFKRAGVKLKRECLDIVLLEEWLGGECGKEGLDLSLDAMVNRYGLKESYRHNAMADAFCVAQIFQMQMRRLADFGIDSLWTLKQALKSCRRAVW